MKKIRASLKDDLAIVEITDAKCDICNANCMHNNVFEGMDLKADWGFSSRKDGQKWRAVICEECVDKYLISLIKFEISSID